MAAHPYAQAFDEAMIEVRRLLDKRAGINKRISELRDTIRVLGHSLDKKRKEHLMDVLNELSVFAPRLTDAVKDALYSAFNYDGPRQLPAVQVKELM